MIFNISEAANLAIHAMTYLASNRPGRPVSTATVSQTLGVSEAHLTKVFQRLKRAGFIKSTRGPKGGVELGRDVRNIKLLDIYETIDGSLAGSTCLLGQTTCVFDRCVFGNLLSREQDRMRTYLSDTTLADLAGDVRGTDERDTPRAG